MAEKDSTAKTDNTRRRVLMLVAPHDFFEPEYSAPRTLFSERGMGVAVATEGRSAVGAQGTTIEADLDVSKADASDFDALFVVGGKGMVEFSGNTAAQKLLRGFMEADKPVALICHAPLLAAKAGLVEGRQVTGWPEIRPDMAAAGAEWTGMPVERDGDLFTGVGPEDAESLADILARRLDGAPALAEAMLCENAAMRKLAWLWRMADSIGDKPMTDEEAERWLREFEREEFEETEAEVPVVQKPVAPVPVAPRPVAPAPKAPPKPEPESVPDPALRKQKTPKPKHEWNIAVDLRPPRTDGMWPEVSETPPHGFPFAADDLKDGPSIRALFKKPETWAALKGMMAHPLKRELVQSYLAPMVVLAIGKSWWEINKRRKQLDNAPFGLFSSEEYKSLQDREMPLEETEAGRAFIALINWHVAKLLQFYLATGGPSGRLDGYIYRALRNRMVNDAGKRQGFESKKQPACAYCQFKRVIKTTPPFLSQTRIHEVQEEGATRKRPLFKCPTCADLVESKEQELRLKEQGVGNAEESLREMSERLRDSREKLAKDPDNTELKNRVETQSAMLEAYKPQVEALAKERDDLRSEVRNRRSMLDVPYSHMGCLNENCPGAGIPLTFVDWDSPFWKTPEGGEARRRLASFYGIAEAPKEQKAEDAPPQAATAERAGKTPPEWMWDVPFRCPFDNARFTPRSAFGHGKIADDGSRLGGLFLDPPRPTVWWRPMSLEQQQVPEDEAKKQRVEETRTQTGVDITTDSNQFLTDQNEKMYYAELADALRQEFYRRKQIHAERTKGVAGNRTAKLEALLYDALLEWSFVHPLHLVGYFTKRMPSVRKVIDKETGEVRDHLEIRSLGRGGAEQIVSSLIQTWFAKVLERPDGWAILRPYLSSEGVDKVPPRGYFVSVVRRGSDGELEVPCGLRYTSGSPIGDKPPRGSSYERDLYVALVEGIWDYDGTPGAKDVMAPIPPERGDAMAKGKPSRLDDMDFHNSHKIVLDSATSLQEGSAVLVKALFMPRHTAWVPIKRIMHLRKDLADPEDDMAGIMDVVGRLADNREEDVRMFARWRKALRQLGMPEQVKRFDEALRKRMEEKGMRRSEASFRAAAKDPLARYKGKREFDETPEPEGKEEKGGNKHRFVIQLHHAKKAGDHYDLRLENDDGALSSWSIPKHRLPKGKEKLLAVKTEDHPVEYLRFKGDIPAGEYGAGTMEIHDSGTYEEIEASKTKIVFRLKGKKEKGTYRLFRAGEGNKWMIMEGVGEKKASGVPPLSKTAAHSGAMLALMAPPAVARRMRKAKMVEDPELAGELHMTLLYLGKAADLGKETLEAVRRAAEKVCARHEPLEMGISGAGVFTPEEDGTPVYVVPNAKGLSALQADLENAIGSIVDLPSEHGWVPHMTVCYCRDGEPELPDLSEKLEWTADKVRLQAGGEKVVDIPIGRKKRGGGEPPLSKRATEKSCWEYLQIILGEEGYDEWVRKQKKPLEEERCEEALDEITKRLVDKYFQAKKIVEEVEAKIAKLREQLDSENIDRDEIIDKMIEIEDKAYYHLEKRRMEDAAWDLQRIDVKVSSMSTPFSKHADKVSRKVKPLFREPVPGQRMWEGIWEKYEDPVKHMREDRPHVILPQNIPDWAVAAEGLERPQDLPSGEGLEPSDPDGRYYVVDMDDHIVARYATKEKAVRNAEGSRWASRVFHSAYADPWDVFVHMDEGDKPVVWESPPERFRKTMTELRAKRGPYYLVDYWGRVLVSYDDLDQAVRNAEGNMYVSQIVFSMVNDPDRGEVVWTKPEPATIQSSVIPPLSRRADDPVYRGRFTFAPSPPSHRPGEWIDYRLPPGATPLSPESEEQAYELLMERGRGAEPPKRLERPEPSPKPPEKPERREEPTDQKWTLLTCLGFNFGWYSTPERAQGERRTFIAKMSGPSDFLARELQDRIDYLDNAQFERYYDFIRDDKSLDMARARTHVLAAAMLSVNLGTPTGWRPPEDMTDAKAVKHIKVFHAGPFREIDLPPDPLWWQTVQIVRQQGLNMLDKVAEWVRGGGDIFKAITASASFPLSRRADMKRMPYWFKEHERPQPFSVREPARTYPMGKPLEPEPESRAVELLMERHRKKEPAAPQPKAEPEPPLAGTEEKWSLLTALGHNFGWYSSHDQARSARKLFLDGFAVATSVWNTLGQLVNDILYVMVDDNDPDVRLRLQRFTQGRQKDMIDARYFAGNTILQATAGRSPKGWKPSDESMIDFPQAINKSTLGRLAFMGTSDQLPPGVWNTMVDIVNDNGRNMLDAIVEWVREGGDILKTLAKASVYDPTLGSLSPPLSRRAALERLPIAADPAMWTDEQLIEAVSKPELFEGDKERFRAAVEQLAKRGLARKVMPRDIGEWREHGWWLLMWAGIPLAFYDNDAKASMARRLLVEDFAKDGTQPEAAAAYDPIVSRLKWPIFDTLYPESAGSLEEADRRRATVGREIGELLSHPHHAKRRKELAESILNISKAPADFEPSKESVSSDPRPTRANSDAAGADITDMSLGELQPGFADPSYKSHNAANDAAEKFVSDTVRKLEKRRKAEEAGFDPEKLADDDMLELALIEPEEVPLSRRATATVGMACPHCYADVSKLEPERTPAGLYKMMTCPECKGAFYPQDALVAAKETGKRELDVGEWPERGWFLLMVGFKPMGFVDGEAAANMALSRWIEMAARGDWGPINLDGIANRALSKLEDMMRDPSGRTRIIGGRALWELAKRQGVGLDKRLKELMTHPMYEKTRRELAKQIADLVPMPSDFTPAPESRVAGSPTDETAEYADVQIDTLLGNLDDVDEAHKRSDQQRFVDAMENAKVKANTTFHNMAKEMAKPVAKKLKWLLEQEGLAPKPEEMADDLPFSKRV